MNDVGDRIAVGCNTNRAYIYDYSGTSWSLFTSKTDNISGHAGVSLTPRGDYIAIHNHSADPFGSNPGAAYIYKISDTGTLTLVHTFTGEANDDNLGWHVYMSDDLADVVMGAKGNDEGGSNAGKLYVYGLDGRLRENIYITDAGKYSVDATIAGLNYKTNEVEVTGSITPVKSFPTTAQKLYPSDGGTVSDSDAYGYVGLSGNGLVMVIVGKGDDDTTADSGGFMVYEKINGVWTYTQQITNVGSGSGTLGDCDEGKSVQLDYTGTRVFIGAHADDNSTTNTGSVYIYRRVAQGNWTLEQTLTGASGSYRYGYNDVNNDGDKLIIGSYGYPGSGNVGRAWYYTRSGTSWSLQDQLAAPSTSAYGNSVGMNSAGTRAIIGGYKHSSNTGRADIWNYSGSSWSRDTGFTGENASDNFGWNVDMSNDGNTVVVGAPIYSGGGEEGRAYIYTTSDGTSWSLTKTLSNQTADERFGFSVQISGDGNTVVIGAAKNDDGVTDGGRSYVYVKSGGSWPSTPTHTIIGTTANSNNGHTLGISDTGETIISGAPFDDDKGTNQGAVYIFDKADIASLTFDGYNQLSLTNTPTYTSSKLFLGSNVYDIGTLTSDLTIETPGLYRGLVYDTSSNVAYFNKVTVGSLATNPLGNYRSVIKLDAGVQHSSFQAGTFCFWAKALDTGTSYFNGFNSDRGFLQLTTQETYHNDTSSYGVLNNANSSQLRGFSATSGNSVYTTFSNPPSSYDPAKWNFYIVYTDSNGGTSRAYLPEFDWTATSSTYGRNHTWLRFDIDDDHVALTDVSIYTGNPGGTDSWRTTLYNGGQIGGAANESTNRVHYFRFHKDNLRDNEGTAANDISSSAAMTTSVSLPGYSADPSLTFDTYNKLTLKDITNPTSKIHALPTGAESTTTYDIGTATNIYIESVGTYSAEMKGSDGFALDSNVVSGLNDPVYITPKLDGGAIYIQGALDNAGGLYLCGLGDGGQLGQGNTTNSTNYVKVKGVGGSGFLENIIDFKLGPGNGFVIACDSSGKCYAWGNNSDGQLGQGNTSNSSTPLQVKGVGGTGFLENIINVSCGHYHSLACDSSGNAYAWGDNYYNSSSTQGQLGDGTTTNKTTPIRVLGVGGSGYLTNIIQVASKPHASQALSSSGHVYCWGTNRYGECGDGTTTNRLTAVQVIGVGGTGYLSGITKLAGGDGYYADCGLALGSNGRVYAWGYNAWGQLGVGNTTNSSTPQIVKGVGGSGYLENIIDVACGGYHCFALDSSGTVYAWGSNSSEAPIGDGTSTQRTTPVKVKGVGNSGYLSDIVEIGGERFGGSAMDSDGNVYAWSGNQNYQVGDGTNTRRSTPVRVLGVGGSGFLNLKVKPVAPSLTFDGYNKYTFTGADTGSTYKLKYESNTYDLGTISNVYIANPGTYSAEIKGATNFALSSNVATIQTVTQPTLVSSISITASSAGWGSYTYEHQSTNTSSTYYEYKISADPTNSVYFIAYNWTTNKWYDTNPGTTHSTFGTSASDTSSTSRETTENPTVVYVMASNSLHAQFINPYFLGPSLDFDTYNKLTLSGLESGSTSNVTFDGNTYSIGTASNVYIENTGTYEAESKGTTTFALTSKAATVDATILEIAFHYGAFSSSYYSSAYSTVGAAATAGHVYSDTTPATYTWGTLNSVDTSTTGQTGYSWTPTSTITANVLMVAGGGGGGGGVQNSSWGEGGGGGETVLVQGETITGGKTIIVGNGGDSSGGINLQGDTGSATSFSTYTANPGLGGGRPTQTSGGTSGSGNLGGTSNSTYLAGGGGGDAQAGSGGNGGDGTDYSSIFGTVYGDDGYFGGGGAGQFGNSSNYIGTGGKGGGASLSASDGETGVPGQPHTGGGGAERGSLGKGGSGIVIIRSGPSPTSPSLTHDGYKLVVKNITPTSTSLRLGSNTYEIGTATNIYVENTGRLYRGNRGCRRLRVYEYHGKWNNKNDRTGVCV
jgi:alpha-tubulin suppressor-like RCC1 family protein